MLITLVIRIRIIMAHFRSAQPLQLRVSPEREAPRQKTQNPFKPRPREVGRHPAPPRSTRVTGALRTATTPRENALPLLLCLRPNLPPRRAVRRAPPLGPGSKAVPECSGAAGSARVPASDTTPVIPKTENKTGKATMCVDPSRGSIPIDCSAPGAQHYTTSPSPAAAADPGVFPPLVNDPSQAPPGAPLQQPAPMPSPEMTTTQPSVQPSGVTQPPQSTASSGKEGGELQLPMSTAQLESQIKECSANASSGRCKCPWAPSKAPTISPYSCGGGEDTVCGIEPLQNKQRQPYDPDEQWSYSRCYEKCTAKLVDYNKQANAYNGLSKQRCPRTYADD
jgi:hypothetical protein